MKNFTIVIPVFNENDNIVKLINEINKALSENSNKYEIIIIDDGSTDNTFQNITPYIDNHKLKYLSNSVNKGQSYSIYYGVQESKYDTIITIDGDGQNNPININDLLNKYFSRSYDLVYGIRVKRKDSTIKKISSFLANRIRSYILKDNCIDTGCSLKIFNKRIFLKIPYFNGIHRFIPALFIALKSNVDSIPVDHRYRKFGTSKYGTIDRLYKGIIDIFKVIRIIKVLKKNHDWVF